MSAQTKMSRLERRGRSIYTVDTAGRERLVATTPTVDDAAWLFASLARLHQGASIYTVEVVQTDDEPDRPWRELLSRMVDGGHLCPHEHTVTDLSCDGHVIVGWRCAGEPFASKEADLGPKMARDVSDAIRATVQMWAAEHERDVAAREIIALIGELELGRPDPTADELVRQLLAMQQAARPDTDPGDLAISVQDDSALVTVHQPDWEGATALGGIIGGGGSIHEALTAAVSNVRTHLQGAPGGAA